MVAFSANWIIPVVGLLALGIGVWVAYVRPSRSQPRGKTPFEDSIRNDLESRSPRFGSSGRWPG